MPTITLSPNSIIASGTQGVSPTGDEEELNDDNIILLSDGESSTGVIFVENNSILSFGVGDHSLSSGDEVTSIIVQCDLISGTKTTLTLKQSINPEDSIGQFTTVSTYVGGPANGIEFSPLGHTDHSKINALRLSLQSSTGDHFMSEIRIVVTYTSPAPGVITLTEGLIILKEGVITL